MRLIASAVIHHGAKTNRVRIGKRDYAVVQPKGRPVYYRQELAVRGLGHCIVCISLPPEELAALDDLAERLCMARSHLIREAVREYAARHP